jgi:hypothetical protein
VSSYPEKIPDGIGSIETFPFSFTAGKGAKRELESQLDQINSRIEKIVDHFVFNDIPIIHFVLKATTNKNDLKKMAKAIHRLADLVEVQEDLSSRLSVIKILEADPTWFTTTFSDYSSEIDKDISSILDAN